MRQSCGPSRCRTDDESHPAARGRSRNRWPWPPACRTPPEPPRDSGGEDLRLGFRPLPTTRPPAAPAARAVPPRQPPPRPSRLRFEIIQQCVVRLVRVALGFGLLTFQPTDLLQERQERRKIVVPASLGPGLLAQHTGAGQFLDQTSAATCTVSRSPAAPGGSSYPTGCAGRRPEGCRPTRRATLRPAGPCGGRVPSRTDK